MGRPPAVSRRHLLRTGAVGAATALAGCTGGGSDSFETWQPGASAWPLAQYDPANTSYNPTASPPKREVEATWTLETDVPVEGLLVADGLLAACGEQGIVVADLGDRGSRLEEYTPAYAAAFGPPRDDGRRLYAAGPIGIRDGTPVHLLRGWTVAANDFEQTLWRIYEVDSSFGPTWLVPNAKRVFLGNHGNDEDSLFAFDADGGDIRWRAAGTYPALGDGSLLASDTADVYRYRGRGGVDAVFGGGPVETWSAVYYGEAVPSVGDGRVVVGGRFSQGGDPPTLFGFDASSGDSLWDPLHLPGTTKSVAVAGDVAYAGSYLYEDFGDYLLPNSGALTAVDLRDGSIRWQRETEWVQWQAVVGNDDVVVTHGGYPTGEAYTKPPKGEGGRVRAYDADSGDVRWTFSTPAPVESVALVGSTVYAGSEDGTVYALERA